MNGTDLMPFGKYSKPPDGPRIMDDVPACYLLWLWDEGVTHSGVRSYIAENFDILLEQCPDYQPEEAYYTNKIENYKQYEPTPW